MHVVAIIHTYSQDKELGSYMTELVRGFEKAGCTLHLIITNDLVTNLQATSLKPSISEDKIIEYIKEVSPSFVFTTNRGGITKTMMEEIQCPIVTWMVDRIPFLHHNGTHSELFGDKDYVVTSSFGNVKRLETIYPKVKGRVFFLPFCTNIDDFSANKEQEQDVNICFVGTFFYCGQLTEIFNTYSHSKEIVQKILILLSKVEENYDLDFESEVNRLEIDFILKDFNLDIYKFKGLLANAVSLNSRIKNLDAISDLGLKLFGTKNWVNVNQYSVPLLRCYQFDHFIKTRQQLVSLYQRSKIAINVSHHQAGNGLPYRIYDIMASKALLITEYREDSDLFQLFGSNIPIPMYKTPQELRRLCSYYLENEDERKVIVEQCNLLVNEKFSFEQRVKDFFTLIDSQPPSIESKGQVIKVDVKSCFTKDSLFAKVVETLVVKLGFLERNLQSLAIIVHNVLENVPGKYKLRIKRYFKLILPLRFRVYLRNLILMNRPL